jgi:arginyl-tRNA synthetase
MLNVSKNKIVNFNLKNATSFTGESGMYILYSIARMKSILRNNKIINNNELKYTNEIENKTIKELSLYSEVIDNLLTTNEPTHLTKYLFRITQLFSKFYESINITNEKNEIIKSSNLRMLKCLISVLESGLGILGISSIDSL